jgi:hypothetical protein
MFENPIIACGSRGEADGCAVAGGIDFGIINIDFSDDSGNIDTLVIYRQKLVIYIQGVENKRGRENEHRTQPPLWPGGVTKVGNCLVVIWVEQIAPSHLEAENSKMLKLGSRSL